jgi:hypothetical protein
MGYFFEVSHSFSPAIYITVGVTVICALLFLVLFRVNADREAVDAYLARHVTPRVPSKLSTLGS